MAIPFDVVVVHNIVPAAEREQTVVIARMGIHNFVAVSFGHMGNKVVVDVAGYRTSSRILGCQEWHSLDGQNSGLYCVLSLFLGALSCVHLNTRG